MVQPQVSSGKEVVVRDRSMMYIIFSSLLLDLLAFTMILPLMPSLMEHYRKNDPPGGLYNYFLDSLERFRILVGAPDHYSSVLFGGALGSLFSFLQFLVSPIAGGLSDVFGRKPVLLASLVGIAFSYVLWAVSHSFAVFVLARIIGGLSKGNVSLSMAAMTDVSSPATRASGMALVGIAFSVGFVVGPVIGAMFAKYGATAEGDESWFVKPALFALSLAVADILFVITCFRETLHESKRAKSLAASLNQAVSYINVISIFKFSAVQNLPNAGRTELQSLGMVYFVYLFVYSGLEFTLTFLTHHNFGFTPMRQGMMFFWMGLTMAVLQGGWVRKMKQQKVKGAAVKGLLLIIPSFVAVGLAYNEYILYLGVFLFAVSTSMVVPCMTTLASQYGGDEQKGTVMGIFRSLGALARALGPILASIAYWSVGSTTTYLVGSVALIWPWYSLKRLSLKQD
ncbi:hypothetical protein GE061_006012 [Apolygus lucorum]|uniref:Major facilitator superfamily (MFS) profile domain-containing protein n=1 Tax=Apolygus lucorum TaxID=248454 RepID=A0A6A4J3B3_APOLU|nr:hypothetical protein GE061_006012 [Apolygus lucorum]